MRATPGRKLEEKEGEGDGEWEVGEKPEMEATALHRSLSKYLTAQDTCDTQTLTKYNRTLARLCNLLYLKPQSTINRLYSVPCIE